MPLRRDPEKLCRPCASWLLAAAAGGVAAAPAAMVTEHGFRHQGHTPLTRLLRVEYIEPEAQVDCDKDVQS